MSSYCLFLMIYSYLKMYHIFYNNSNDYNYGYLLIGFLCHYVNYFDFKSSFIDPNANNPFIQANFPLEEIPLIIEPITKKNAGKNIYRIFDVVNALNEIYIDIISFMKNETKENIIYLLFDKYLNEKKE